MAVAPETTEPAVDGPTEPVAAAAPRLSRPALITIVGLAAAVLIAIIVIIVLVLPKGGTELADAPIAPVPSATPTPRPSATPTRTATPKPTKTADAVAAPPAPVEPAPAPVEPVAPAPVAPPALPAPPAPVTPIPTITSMDAYYSGPCTTSTQIFLAWTSTNGSSANINVRSGGGTPVFNQNWQGYPANGNNGFYLDCTRPIWFFTLTITNSAGSKDGRLTFANGSSQGWSSN